MILRDRIVATTRVVTGTDIYGNEVYGDVTAGPYPAEVRPLGSVENVTADRTQVVTRYRIIVPANAQLTASSAISWRGGQYEVTGSSRWRVRAGVL